MIIRRRHKTHFLTLPNQLVRDTRLSLDEHGMLHYLLSLPDDWEVSRANCARFWGIGTEKCARIFRSLRRTGWAQVERIHGEDGTFLGVRWIISDEPGQEMDEAAIAASESGEDDADEAAASVTAAEPARHHDAAQPSYGLTMTRVNHDMANPHHGICIDSTKTDSDENRDSKNPPQPPVAGAGPPPTLDALIRVWPPDHVLSRHAADRVFARMPASTQAEAIRLSSAYLDDCRRHARKVCDLATFLRERRWERLVKGGDGAVCASIELKPYSPQWHRWRDYKRAVGQPFAFMETRARQGESWWERTEWPPPIPPEAKAGAPPGSRPGEAAMSEEDVRELARV
ncbi:MAG: hypothetical protein EPO23_03330 [Xanthobacteraceae bacterium]|nr:MAG: hypothetical protein EPO23_03330 [Xanthobacteraceae bacterium]